MENINIRKAEVGDEIELARIQTRSWEEAFKDILSDQDLKKYANQNSARSMYRKILEDHIGHGYLLEINGKPNYLAWWNQSQVQEQKEYAELIAIHSLPENWGKGYGTFFLKYLFNEMKLSGYTKVILWVFCKNERARGFYEKLGFVATSRTKTFLNADEVCYEKEL